MTTQTTAQPQPGATTGDSPRGTGFGGLLRAEWTKFRSVRGWVIGMILAALLMVFIGVFAAANSNIGCQINGGPPKSGKACVPPIPHGPGGEVVHDSFSFVHQPLTGNGSITARVTSLTGEHADLTGGPVQVGNGPGMVPGLGPCGRPLGPVLHRRRRRARDGGAGRAGGPGRRADPAADLMMPSNDRPG